MVRTYNTISEMLADFYTVFEYTPQNCFMCCEKYSFTNAIDKARQYLVWCRKCHFIIIFKR